MPIIKTYETNEATGELLEIYNEIIKVRGSVGNNAKLFSSSPELLKQQLDFIKYYSTHPTLSMPLLASIRICVSSKEECNFCIDFNTAMLVNYSKWTLEEVQSMKKDLDSSKLTQKENALLKFVINSMKNPHKVNENDMNELRKLDWQDKDIIDALNHGARMLATDIIFNTFKIEDYKA